MSRNQYILLAIIGLVVVMFYFGNEQSENGGVQNSTPQSPSQSRGSDVKPREFAGYACTGDCSGHEAGYKWAEEHDITDGDDCDTAGKRSNSPSFAEGCHAYVDGESDREDAEDPNNEN